LLLGNDFRIEKVGLENEVDEVDVVVQDEDVGVELEKMDVDQETVKVV
jgi:hypothetical protein